MDFKRCACCGRLLPVEDFSKNKRNKDGLHSYCRECNRLKAAEFLKKSGPGYLKKYSQVQRKKGYFRYGKGAYLNMLRSSEKRNIKFELTPESLKEWWLSTEDNCFYCGCTTNEYIKIKDFIKNYSGNNELINHIKEHVFNKMVYYNIETMTIDRVDSFGPYSLNNIVKSCWICNSIKSNKITAKEMAKIGKENLVKIRGLMYERNKKTV